MQSPDSTTRHYQSALATYCRTGIYHPIPGVRQSHLNHYRRLVYNVVDDILQSAYPLTYNFLSSMEWDDLVHEFLSSHPCQSPQVWHMPKELYEYVVKEGDSLLLKYPFLPELLYFEWLEVELFMMEDKKGNYTAEGDLNTGPLVLNPEHILLHFQYPVHLKKAKHIISTDKGDYYVVMFRHPYSGEIQFMDLSPAFVYLLEQLVDAPVSMTILTKEVCDALQISYQEDVVSNILKFVTCAIENKLILGFEVK